MNKWLYLRLPLLLFIAPLFDMSLSSYVSPSHGFYFHYSWIFLIPINVLIVGLVFYFYTYRGGRMFRRLRKGESKSWHLIKGLIAAPFIICLFSWGIFHAIFQISSYLPMVPIVSKEILVTKIVDAGGRGVQFVDATDSGGNNIRIRLRRPVLSIKTGTTYSLTCKDVKVMCRIIDLHATS